ncbi:MAG: inner membrane CreD family protein [Burkholderiaceae bacterium]
MFTGVPRVQTTAQLATSEVRRHWPACDPDADPAAHGRGIDRRTRITACGGHCKRASKLCWTTDRWIALCCLALRGTVVRGNLRCSQSRATKHGAIIIALAFGAMFLFDMLRSLNAHPLQYGFLGLALVIFFRLLLSLSEHIAFGLAYSIAASACTLLITYYPSYVFADRTPALGFGAALASMYVTIYSILIAEGTALLMGSVLLFVVLAAAIIVTRQIDWRNMSRGAKTDLT